MPAISLYNRSDIELLVLDLGEPDASKPALLDSDGARIR
jgi:hypothetical protein